MDLVKVIKLYKNWTEADLGVNTGAGFYSTGAVLPNSLTDNAAVDVGGTAALQLQELGPCFFLRMALTVPTGTTLTFYVQGVLNNGDVQDAGQYFYAIVGDSTLHHFTLVANLQTPSLIYDFSGSSTGNLGTGRVAPWPCPGYQLALVRTGGAGTWTINSVQLMQGPSA